MQHTKLQWQGNNGVYHTPNLCLEVIGVYSTCDDGAGAAVGHTSTVWSVAFSRDGSQLASVSDDYTLRVWQLGWQGGPPAEPHFTLAASISGHHQRTIFSVDWSADGVLATGG